MAHINVLAGGKGLASRLNTHNYVVDIKFLDKRTFDQNVESGFNPEEWIKKNKQDIYIGEDLWKKKF